MFDLFLADGLFPFALSLALLFGLLILELVFAFVGGTLLGAGSEGLDGPDGPDIDFDAPDFSDLEIDLDGVDIDPGDLELADLSEAEMPAATEPSGVAAWLGFGKMPALIWLAAILMAFGLSGMVLQVLSINLFGGAAPWWIPALPAGVFAIWFARSFGGLFARLLPKVETEALSERHLGRRMGIVTQVTAQRGRPAEVKVTDRYGNIHYLRAEPLRDQAAIPTGTEVMVLRHRYETGYLLVPLSDISN